MGGADSQFLDLIGQLGKFTGEKIDVDMRWKECLVRLG